MRESWILLVDSNRGVYIPQSFESMYRHLVTNADELADNLDGLKDAEGQFYWEDWSTVEDNAKLTIEGKEYTIRQTEHSDLWAVPVDYDWDSDEETYVV